MTDLITRDPNDTGEIARPLTDQTATALGGEVTRDLSNRVVHVITTAPHQTLVIPLPPPAGVHDPEELAETTARMFVSQAPPLRTADPDAGHEPIPHREGLALPDVHARKMRIDMAAAQPIAPMERVAALADTDVRLLLGERVQRRSVPYVMPAGRRSWTGPRHRRPFDVVAWMDGAPLWARLSFAAGAPIVLVCALALIVLAVTR